MAEKFIKNVHDLRDNLKKIFPENDVSIIPSVSIQATTLDDLYFKTIVSCLKHGRLYKIDSGSYSGSHRIEFDEANLYVTNPTARPLAPIPRQGIPVSTNDEKIAEYFLTYLMDGRLEPNEHYKYSSWIVGMPREVNLEHKGVQRGTRLNQLEWCMNHFLEDGYGTNHCYITVGCAEGLQRYDWSEKGCSDAEKGSTECLRGISLKIKGNRLNLKCIFRSWDLIGGLPENLGGLTMLMEYIVDSINDRKKPGMPEIKTGILYASSDGLHIYEHHLDLAKLWTNIVDDKSK